MHGFASRGLSDAEATQLPVQIDALTLNAIEIFTWRTDAGDLDVLVDIPGRDGTHRQYEDLASRAQVLEYGGMAVRVARLDDSVYGRRSRSGDQQLLDLGDRAPTGSRLSPPST